MSLLNPRKSYTTIEKSYIIHTLYIPGMVRIVFKKLLIPFGLESLLKWFPRKGENQINRE
jgi:hypothetical protein